LWLVGGAFLLTVALAPALVVWNSYRQAQAAAGTAMEQSARLLEQGLTRSLESLDTSLQRIAGPLADGTDDLEAVARLIRDALRFAPHLRQVLILDAQGRVVLDSAAPEPAGPHRGISNLEAWGLGPEAPRSLGSSLRIGTAVPGRYLLPRDVAAEAAEGRWTIPVELEGAGGARRVVAALNPDFFLRAFAAVLSGPVEEAILVRYDGLTLAGHGVSGRDGEEAASGPGPDHDGPAAWGWPVDASLAGLIHDGILARQSMSTPVGHVAGTVAVRLSEVYPVAVVLAYGEEGLRAQWMKEERAAIVGLWLAPAPLGVLAVVAMALMRHRLRLRDEVRVLSRVVEEAPVAVIVTDRTGRIEFVNDSFTSLLGYGASEAIGRSPALLKSGHGNAEIYRDLWQTILSGGVWRGEFLNRTKDGRLVWMTAAVSGVRDDNGMVTRFVAVETDVTERKRTDAAMAAMVARLDATNRELEQLAHVASHDLQEPLRMVTGYLSLLHRRYAELLPEEARDFIGHAVAGADRMRGLIKDLLAYSQVSNRRVALHAVAVDEVVAAAVHGLKDKIAATSACVEVGPLPTALAERTNLATLFHNLIDNALTHHHPDRAPVIRIYCEDTAESETDQATDGYWAIVVEDNGRGIARRDFERVFRLFQHLQDHDSALGNGVGLAVARRIAERAGGAITVQSDGETGSRFRVLLPKGSASCRPPSRGVQDFLSPPASG
jgi:PAS domain S-box-containing protein